MKTLFSAIAAAVVLWSPLPSTAADHSVSVSIGPQLQAQVSSLGQRDLDQLSSDLTRAVQSQVDRVPRLAGAKIDLVITAATPNRPTFQQLSNTPGLSFQSYGVGGATVDGTVTSADGVVTPVHYRWYESDISQAENSGVWEDAQYAFRQFAHGLARGERLATR